jgi:signal transduction histidine kinase
VAVTGTNRGDDRTEAPLEDRPDSSSSSVTATSPAEVRSRPGQIWGYARGPILATIVLAASYLLTRTSFPIPDLPLIYLVVIVGIATVDGSRSAIVSGLIIVLYVAYADSRPGHLFTYTGNTIVRLGIFAATALAAALVAGVPARRAARLRRELFVQTNRLSDALQAKREFMNAAAHQLRTPLTVIAGYVSMLQDETFGRLPERFRDPIAAMQRKAREVVALIDEMLLAARIQRGTAPAVLMPIDVRDAVRKAVERAEPRVTLEQATLSYELPSNMVAAEVDSDQLAHILDSLIRNALTYTDGRPWVKITVTAGSDVRVMIRDRGWGVPEDMRQKIFEGFAYHTDPDRKRKSGKGLGLSISRELAERYGGSLDLIRTSSGKGSIFVLRLPLAAP